MVTRDDGILIAKAGQKALALLLARANRHGLIAGATGTGKTVTLQTLAEGFSAAGVPVFLADVKGDLAGLAMPGEAKPKLVERLAAMGLGPMRPAASPVLLWDLLGAQGHPVRTTVSELGPMLLGRLLGLNEVQEGVLNLAFTVADEQGLLLLDLKDLRALLAHVSEHAGDYAQTHGNVSPASVGAIQRALLVLEQQGADKFLGEPALALEHLMLQDSQGRGGISILAADKLMANPRLYAMFLLWLLSELFEQLPEVGDLDRPKLVFFFDEAHLLFDDAPPALVDKVEQVVRLVRSKGVGIFFVTQNPLDIPESILGQLGNRVQHALRAFTPRDQKAVRAAAETFRANPKLKTETVIGELAVGEALVSLLDADGTPAMVERALIRPPLSRLGALKPEERQQVMAASPVAGLYDQAVDRESAFEVLQAQAAAPEPAASTGGVWSSPWGKAIGAVLGGGTADPAPTTVPSGPGARSSRGGFAQRRGPPARQQQGLAGAIAGTLAKQVARSVASQIGTQIGRQIVRGILGGILK